MSPLKYWWLGQIHQRIFTRLVYKGEAKERRQEGVGGTFSLSKEILKRPWREVTLSASQYVTHI